MVDVRTLPRLEGAVEDTARTESYRLNYSVPTVVAITTAATRKLLAANGWQEYVHPSSQSSRPMSFKKGRHGLYVSFTQGLGRPDQSVVHYSADRLYANVPFPEDATDIVYDTRRPYLNCITAATVEASARFLPQGTAGSRLVGTVRGRYRGALAERQTRRDDRERRARLLQPGCPRRRPQATADHAGAAAPRRRQDRRRDQDRAVRAAARPRPCPGRDRPADAGYHIGPRQHRQFGLGPPQGRAARSPPTCPWCWPSFAASLAARNWKEEANGAVITDNDVTLNFSSADQTAQLTLAHKYDLTFVNLVTQVKEAALAARAKAKKEADDKFLQRCAGDRAAVDGRRRGAKGRAGGQPVGCAVARARRRRPSRCRCRMAPRTSSSTAPTADSNSIPPPA